MKAFDAIVIGAGQAGVPLAKKLAMSGLKTALIEKRLVGGTCINEGCTPTKTLVASARMAWLAGRSHELGIDIPAYEVNFKAIMARKDKIVTQFREGAIAGLEETENLTLVYGNAKFIDDHTLYIAGNDGSFENYTARKIFINTGATPLIPEIEGIADISYFSSATILDLKEIPEHLLIVGGGYIGLEFAQLFSRFGSRITLLERGDLLMPQEDDDVCRVMSEIFQQEGIEIFTGAEVQKFSQGYGQIEVLVKQKGKTVKHHCSHVLLATGRKPQTDTLGLENTNISCDEQGHIQVNEYLETSAKNVYALGDVKGGPAFTHIAYNDYVVLSSNIIAHTKLSITDRMVPYCMFTDPQVGRIGLTETVAKAQGLDFLVAKIPMKNVARAIETAETRGFMKAIVDKKSKQILGATIIGEAGGEIMTILQVAMMGKLSYEDIRYAIFAHPLYAESLNNLFMSVRKPE